MDSQQCYLTSAVPTSMDWTKSYNEDASTKIMLHTFMKAAKPIWSEDALLQVEVEYRSNLKVHLICMLHDKIVLHKAIFKNV